MEAAVNTKARPTVQTFKQSHPEHEARLSAAITTDYTTEEKKRFYREMAALAAA
jgi:hypothetical protein